MAKHKRRKSKKTAAKQAAVSHGHKHKYQNREFSCYGKPVRAGRSTKKIPRMFCARVA